MYTFILFVTKHKINHKSVLNIRRPARRTAQIRGSCLAYFLASAARNFNKVQEAKINLMFRRQALEGK